MSSFGVIRYGDAYQTMVVRTINLPKKKQNKIAVSTNILINKCGSLRYSSQTSDIHLKFDSLAQKNIPSKYTSHR